MSNSPNFNKSFEALYNIAMEMADNCIVKNTLEDRFNKLEEEHRECLEAFSRYKEELSLHEKDERLETMMKVVKANLIGELADVLFVLLHTAHTLGETPFQLLHRATSKLLGRMNDDGYVAKN
jgi:NTP pyrophosphatase (non-canonical NTP hydrolase)